MYTLSLDCSFSALIAASTAVSLTKKMESIGAAAIVSYTYERNLVALDSTKRNNRRFSVNISMKN